MLAINDKCSIDVSIAQVVWGRYNLPRNDKTITPLKNNISCENWWLEMLEDEISFLNGPFWGDMIIFRGVH